MKKFHVHSIVLLILVQAQLVGAVTLIQDSFDSLLADESLNGRAPDVQLVGGNWLTNSVNLKGDGDGGIKAVYTASRSISIDLGVDYFATNPGVYELSMSLKSPDANTNSWVGIGFAAAAGDSTSLSTVDNAARAWVMMRQSGSVNVYAGPAATNALTGGVGLPSVSGVVHTLTLVLDTSQPNWTLQMLLDGASVDLGITEGNKTHVFDGGLPDLRYLMIGVSQGGVANPSGVAVIDDFLFTGPAPIPEPGTAILIAVSCVFCFQRKRQD